MPLHDIIDNRNEKLVDQINLILSMLNFQLARELITPAPSPQAHIAPARVDW